jgi:quercetin dioxygenase-like cupin family protein
MRRFLAGRKRLVALAAAAVLGIAAAAAYAALPSANVPVSSVGVGTLASINKLNILDPASFAVAQGGNSVAQRLHFNDGQSTGWHTHPGPNVVLVVSGGFELIDDKCNVTFYGPGQGFATGTAVHEAIAMGPTDFYSIYLLPPDAQVLRTDASPPACATIPGIPGDGNDEDTTYVPQGVPLLHVHVSPHWFGSVQSTPYLIDCPRACERAVGGGTQLTLKATANSGWAFDHWSLGPCDGQTSPSCSFSMPTANLTDVVAYFKKSS